MNRRIVLARRPQGLPTADCFRLETTPVPQAHTGELLLRTLYLSLDPYMRGRMSDEPSYVAPVAIDEVMCGATICRIDDSHAVGFATGDIVHAYTGWQDYAVTTPTGLTKLDAGAAPVSWSLGVLGMTGLTAYVGLLDIGQPQTGETVVVPAATGAVGSVVGQIAKLKGCRIVGVAGGPEKCDYAVRKLGFDACVDHSQGDLAQKLAAACPRGIDVYFENVGGPVSIAIWPLLNINARVPVCGLIAWYNLTELPAAPDLSPMLMRTILVKRVKVQGFVVSDHFHRHADFVRDMSGWLKAKLIKYREDIVDGLERAPRALNGLLRGENFGKLVVRVAAG